MQPSQQLGNGFRQTGKKLAGDCSKTLVGSVVLNQSSRPDRLVCVVPQLLVLGATNTRGMAMACAAAAKKSKRHPRTEKRQEGTGRRREPRGQWV